MVTLLSAILAFNKSTRVMLYGAVFYSFIWLATKITHLYPKWKNHHLDSESIGRWINKRIEKLKIDSLEQERKSHDSTNTETRTEKNGVPKAAKEAV